MSFSATAKAVRAISVEFGRRLYVPVFITGTIILALVLALVIWLVTISSWWWLLLIPVIIVIIVFFVLSAIAAFILRVLRPAQTKAQTGEIRQFVDMLQEVAETVQTPKPFLLFRLAKDTLFPRGDGLVKQMTSHATSLTPKFKAIVASFH